MRLLPDDALVRETERDLVALENETTARQIRAIHLIGLEREQIVAVAYREDALRGRLTELAIDEVTRTVIRHALRWIWKEEEMHTTFVRGVLLRAGGPILRARAFFQQAAGAIAGWSSAVLQHVRWREAPLSRFWAHLLTFFGWLAGKVPRAAVRSLRHLTFRDYCRFSIAAEATAAMCWHRVAALVERPDAPAAMRGLGKYYARMASDEDHHGAIFSLLLEALTDEGSLAPEWTELRLRERLLAIGPFYVGREHRPGARDSPLGGGGDVVVVCDHASCTHGPDAGDATAALERLLERVDLGAIVAERAAQTGKLVSALRVAIKPTFMRAYHRDDPSPTTSPALVRALAVALRARGVEDVALLESAHIYDWFFERRDVASVAAYAGFVDPSFRVVDVERDLAPHRFARGMVDEQVSATWRDADLRIAFGKLSTHPVDRIYSALAQLESLVPRLDEDVFVDRRTHRGPATMALLHELPPHLSIVDAYENVADGIGGVIASERPASPRRLYGGRDAIAVDLTIAAHARESDPRVSPHLDAAMFWFDDPRGRTVVRGCDRPLAGWRSAYHDERSAVLGFFAHPMYVLASGRGAIFLPEMDEGSFPPRAHASRWLGWVRRAVRWLLETRLPHRPAGRAGPTEPMARPSVR